jgi:hypothetical protein
MFLARALSSWDSAVGNENGLAAEGEKLADAGSVRDPCGFGPDKAARSWVKNK